MLLQAQAVVDLGMTVTGKFYLFYSLFDKDCKIALVSHDMERLISVWGKDFFLPKGVRRPTEQCLRKAKKRASELISGGLIQTDSRGALEAQILVLLKEEVLYTHPVEFPIEEKDAKEEASLVRKLRVPLEEILKALDASLAEVKFSESAKQPLFKIRIKNRSGGGYVKYCLLRKRTVASMLQTTA